DTVAALAKEMEGLRLMRVERFDPSRAKGVPEVGIDRVGNRDRAGGTSGETSESRHGPPGFGDEAVDQVGEVDARFPGPRHLGVNLRSRSQILSMFGPTR